MWGWKTRTWWETVSEGKKNSMRKWAKREPFMFSDKECVWLDPCSFENWSVDKWKRNGLACWWGKSGQGSIHTAVVHAHDSSHLNSEWKWQMERQPMKMYHLLRKRTSAALQKSQVLRKKNLLWFLRRSALSYCTELLYRV